MAENAKGALFKELDKKGSQPDWTGSIEMSVDFMEAHLAEAKKGGGLYKARLAAWLKDGPKGKFLSLSFNAPFTTTGAPSNRRPAPDEDDPFR